MLLNQHPHWQHLNIRQAETVEHICTYTNLNQLLILSPQNYALTHLPKNTLNIIVGEKSEHCCDVCSQELSAIRPESISCILVSLGFKPKNTQNFLAQVHTILKPSGILIIINRNDPWFLWRLSSGYLRKLYKQCLSNKRKIIRQSKRQQLEFIENVSFSIIHPWIIRNFPMILSKIDAVGLYFPIAIGQFNATILQKQQLATLSQHQSALNTSKEKTILSSITKKNVHAESYTIY